MTKIPNIEETLDEVEKYWDTDRTEATRAIMRYASGQRTALLTELSEYTSNLKGVYSAHDVQEAIKAHLGELINPSSI